jgi:hypothetical protein
VDSGQGANKGAKGARNEKGRMSGLPGNRECLLLDFHDISGANAFITVYDIEGDAIAFVKGLETVRLDGGKMHENIVPVFPLNEAKSLLFVEPLNDPLKTHTKILHVKKSTN